MKIRNIIALLSILSISINPIRSSATNLGELKQKENSVSILNQNEEELLDDNIYIIGPGDLLELRIFATPELSGKFEVLSDGSVSIPLVGDVQVSGLTLQQAAKRAQKLLGKQLLRPQLQLLVAEPRPIRVSVIGDVERPGLYSLTTNERTETAEGGIRPAIDGLPTVVDAIKKAGGITQQANLRKVKLQRRLPGKRGQFKLTHLNLLELILEGNQLQNPILFDGDTIKVERAEEIPSDAIEIAAANLSPEIIRVNIIGEVKVPGLIKIKASTPLVQGILAAGGLKEWRASTGNVELIRINRNGSATLRRIRFDLNSGVSDTTNPPLRDGDTVRVNRSFLAKGSDAVKAVSEPVGGLVTIWSLFRLVQSTE